MQEQDKALYDECEKYIEKIMAQINAQVAMQSSESLDKHMPNFIDELRENIENDNVQKVIVQLQTIEEMMGLSTFNSMRNSEFQANLLFELSILKSKIQKAKGGTDQLEEGGIDQFEEGGIDQFEEGGIDQFEEIKAKEDKDRLEEIKAWMQLHIWKGSAVIASLSVFLLAYFTFNIALLYAGLASLGALVAVGLIYITIDNSYPMLKVNIYNAPTPIEHINQLEECIQEMSNDDMVQLKKDISELQAQVDQYRSGVPSEEDIAEEDIAELEDSIKELQAQVEQLGYATSGANKYLIDQKIDRLKTDISTLKH